MIHSSLKIYSVSRFAASFLPLCEGSKFSSEEMVIVLHLGWLEALHESGQATRGTVRQQGILAILPWCRALLLYEGSQWLCYRHSGSNIINKQMQPLFFFFFYCVSLKYYLMPQFNWLNWLGEWNFSLFFPFLPWTNMQQIKYVIFPYGT